MKILVINAGSSSLKYQLIDMDNEKMLAKGNCEKIGLEMGIFGHKTADGREKKIEIRMANHTEAFEQVKNALLDSEVGVIKDLSEVAAIGHRIVQGGALFSESVLVDEKVIEGIESLIPLAPLHNSAHVQGIRACIRNALRVNAEHLQETHRKAFTVFNDGDEQVLRADVVTAELGGRELCHLQNTLCARGEICGGEVRRRRNANLLLHQAFVIVCRDAELIQHVERNAAALCNQAVEHVLTADVIVAKFLRLFDGAVHGIVCFLCKTCESIHINSRPFDHCRIAVLFTDFLLLKRFEGFAHLVCAENVSLPRRKVAAVCGYHGGRLYRYGQCVNIFKRYTA